jgi:eukaryotic-like serine/threonine-protein kinase
MEPHPRYEIFAEIASGDFATVFRGRDRELGRDVAIKQIHRQFLSDARQLERYWQEAQLLASLQHRNILTIYDIVRPRGWLILELMQSNLHQAAHGEPMDLDQLRVALTCSLQALKFLHENGVIHGDIKPSNLFVDKRNWVKLGDFGLARRVSNDRGSLLKGTTRYMAPELVSEQFGPVGPASDLYSLGFTAYELMCGAQFDSLFPGLEAFGRDKQIAWMMWHAAADRRLPDIHRVLEGVPDDLALVVQKLCAKNPAQRYRTADEALADLHVDPSLADTLAAGPTEAELAAEASRKKRRKRIGILATFAASGLVMAAIALLASPEKPQPKPAEPPPVQGVVRNVLPEKHTLVIESEGKPLEYSVHSKDHLFLNGTASLLRDLKDGDHLKIKKMRDESGATVLEIYASRPARSQGIVESVEPDEGLLTLAIGTGDVAKQLKLSVPQNIEIRLNNQPQVEGAPVTLANLLPGDHVTVEHDGDSDVQTATSLSAIRGMTDKGVIRELDPRKKELTLALSTGDDAKLVTLPIADSCEITLNDHRFLEGRVLKPADLKVGDEAIVVHDTTILRVDARRIFGQTGLVLEVRSADRVLEVRTADGGKSVSWTVAADCKITLNEQPAELADLHRNDKVSVTHDSPDSKGAEVATIDATRDVDPHKWAVAIGIGAYEDSAVTPPKLAAADAQWIADTLAARYQVEPDHLLTLVDISRIRLEQSLPAFLDKVPADAELMVFFEGQAYADSEGKILLAPTDFALARLDATGVPLAWFVETLEKCAAKDKLLLFDTCHAGKGADQKNQPSPSEMLNTLKLPGALSPLRSLTAIVSCRQGERSQDLPAQDGVPAHGRFASFVSAGLTGQADKNRDNRLEATELFEFLAANLPGKGGQTPELFLPDATPPRLSPEAKLAIRKLSSDLKARKMNVRQAAADFEEAEQLAGKEPEPKLLYALILTKALKEKDALKQIEDLRAAQPDLLLALEIGAWLHFRKQDYTSGTTELVELLTKMSASKTKNANREQLARLLTWTGRLREFAAVAAGEQYRPPQGTLEEIDAAVARFPAKAQRLYEEGREQVRVQAAEFDKKIAAEGDKSAMLQIQVKRRQLPNYATFPLDPIAKGVLERLDQ